MALTRKRENNSIKLWELKLELDLLKQFTLNKSDSIKFIERLKEIKSQYQLSDGLVQINRYGDLE